jgi:hypothetical protein
MTAILERSGSAHAGKSASSSAAPSSQKAIGPRVEANPQFIVAARRFWMSKIGLPSDEIDELCDFELYPGTLEDELAQIAALQDIAELNQKIAWNL